MARVSLILVISLFFGVVFSIDFGSSSSESCEDDSHGHGGGGGGHGGGHGGGNGGGGGANGGCPTGWRRFNRPNGGWCLKSFGGVLNQAAAEAQCKSYGGTLSGLQNLEEARYATRTALPLLGRASGSLWVGAKRTRACTGQVITASCTGLNSFGWTDGSATGTAGFVWSTKQPDNAHDKKQDCAILLATRQSSLTVKNVVWAANTLDDVACVTSAADTNPRAVAGYLCGKAASR
ncbi:hypothetical protein GCK72_003488 [Caenorhabditis remanei]|uniref:C-type lectin domain-containing protein n=1 Tax=Caenorhabditis remanei TaxID=31234 RepID=A0A6A5HWI9_CAERE|nr:hypothetical protein GCK72_003488 [Caenorhabditis remanei]KAF1771661.1 hypothetical protein GCK72_003488 [Caenorhabditis remanei]